MRRIFWLMLMVCLSGAVRAQTFAEWFDQKKTRLEYYEKQIAALQVYIGLEQKGMKLVQSGLNLIGDIKKGEFDLHNDFYASLEAINPSVGNMAEVAEIVALQAAIIEKFKQSLARYRSGAGLNGTEIGYIGQVYSNLMAAGLEDINALVSLTTANKLKMRDDERVLAIRALDGDMRDKYQFAVAFTGQADLFGQQRLEKQAELGSIGAWYGLP
jgi:hypothetical protein